MKINQLKGLNTRTALMGGVLILAAGSGLAIARAQTAPRDPASMPEVRGKVVQYDLTPRGDVDGLILADGTEVHFPPHLGLQVQAAVRPGDEVTVRGERNGTVVRAGSVANANGGAAIVDRGPPPGGPNPGDPKPRGPKGGGPNAGGPRPGPAATTTAPMDASGVVKQQLHGPRGDLNGVLLEDGTIVHLPPAEATRLADSLKAGQTVAVRGRGVSNAAGRSIGAESFGPSLDKLTALAVPPPPKAPAPPGGPAPAPAPASAPRAE